MSELLVGIGVNPNPFDSQLAIAFKGFLRDFPGTTQSVRKSKQKNSTLIDAEPDRISCLPGHVTDQILSFLPIEEAVRTSVLSSKWRNKWYTIPNLVFDPNYVSEDPSIVDHVLLLHSGPINKFEISDLNHIPVNSSVATDIDRWILHLIRRSIKELVLDLVLMDEVRYKIPWCLFSCQSLNRLELYSCWLKPPTTFEGLRNLTSLDLDHVTINQDHLEKLISGCPLLENLMLTDIDNITQLNVHAPKLKEFDILGVVPVELPTPCICLGDLSLCINFEDLKEISAALCLLRSSHNLQKLEISARIEEDTDLLTPTCYSWEDIFSRPAMPIQVRHVTIGGISGTTSELDFIKFLLLYSPVLENMIVKPDKDVTPDLTRALIRFKRASAEAEVIWEE
ncbi:F-box/FBD/LRR-repeat protein [Trifolium pratense]|uniref:F-box/FBD/LRR-repeat protein n=1 Tax=Trifolium pratense TaxID=57577 RepID=A0A2K3N5G3_TRIPR|nr:F-box/FBD/LRR-repeat protein [Trifolium pratense]